MADPKGVSPQDAARMTALVDEEHRQKAAQEAADKVCGKSIEGFADWLMDNAKNHPQAAAAFIATQPEFTGTMSAHVQDGGATTVPPIPVTADDIVRYGVFNAARDVIASRHYECVSNELQHPSSEMTATNGTSQTLPPK